MPKTSNDKSLFPGFPPQLFRFLRDLKANNDRNWFADNKSRYLEDVVEPALQFIRAIQPQITKFSRFLEAIPKRQGGSLLRIYRDTRFSNNKLPYKTNIGIHFRHSQGGDIHAPGLYVHLEPESCFVGAGIWMPCAEPLALIRATIAENPRAFQKIYQRKDFLAKFRLEGDSLKTAPRGFAKDHPAILDLRRKSFIAVAHLADNELTGAQSLKTIVDRFSTSRPIMKYLCDALQQPF